MNNHSVSISKNNNLHHALNIEQSYKKIKILLKYLPQKNPLDHPRGIRNRNVDVFFYLSVFSRKEIGILIRNNSVYRLLLIFLTPKLQLQEMYRKEKKIPLNPIFHHFLDHTSCDLILLFEFFFQLRSNSFNNTISYIFLHNISRNMRKETLIL